MHRHINCQNQRRRQRKRREGCRGTEKLETGKEWENKSEQIHNSCSEQLLQSIVVSIGVLLVQANLFFSFH